MASNKKVAIVTGSNKGIGFEIVKGLCKRFDGDVILTSRNPKNGQEAASKLKEFNLHPKIFQLDILDQNSIENLAEHIKKVYGGLDLLINNAAIVLRPSSGKSFGLQAEETIETNYKALRNVCNIMFPLLRENARVVNMSSVLGHLSFIASEDLKAKLKDENLTEITLNGLMDSYVMSAKAGTHKEDGWGESMYFPAYAVSKVGITALTRVQQRDLDKEVPCRNISVNCVHPGYVATDMTEQLGPLNTEQGAVAPLYVALEKHGWKGQYVWRDCTSCDWTAPSPPAEY